MRSEAGGTLRIAHSISGEVQVSPVVWTPNRGDGTSRTPRVRDLGDGLLEIPMLAGDDLVIRPAGERETPVISAVPAPPAKPWGLPA